jgi:hypothetical protein
MLRNNSVRSGSKLLLKFCATECEQFNRQVYAMLDLVKKFENKYKLKSITTHQYYSLYGPIALIAWLQREHTDLLKDHEWPALASKLPQSNYFYKTMVALIVVALIMWIHELATNVTK